MPIPVTHNTELPVIKMVYRRLSFIPETDDNNALMSDFTQEAFHELEPCFKAAEYVLTEGATPPTGYENAEVGDTVRDEARITVEANYSVAQKSLVADVVTIYVLMQFAHGITDIDGTSSGGSSGTYIKKAKAGSVEVEYGVDASVSTGANAMDKLKLEVEKLLALYKATAARKAKRFGCVLDVCDDCDDASNSNGGSSTAMPFIVQSDCNC